jgi:ABC-type nitrate/sulfonate/bicarbonate transport system substrate-binding protein
MITAVSRREALGQFAAGAALAALGACGRPAAGNGAITIANAAGGLNMTLAAVMRQQRFLEAAGLKPDVSEVADGSRILGGLMGGTLDGSFMSGFGQVFPAIERGADIRVIGGAILLPVLAMFTSKPEIRRLKDLEGRTVGCGSIGALVYQLTVTLLRNAGVDVTKIRFVNVGSSADIFRAVGAGTVDAGVGQASQIEDAARYGVTPIAQGNMAAMLKAYTYAGAWTTLREIETKRDVIVKTLAAYARLYRFVQTPEAHGAFIAARRSVFPRASAADHEAEWRFVQRYKPLASDLVLAPERLDYMQQLNRGFGVQKTVLPFARVADMSLAQDALKLVS